MEGPARRDARVRRVATGGDGHRGPGGIRMSASRRLRVGVPADLLELRAEGGHGKVWHRVLAGLSRVVEVTPIGTARRPARRVLSRRPGVILADGHADLPPVRAPLVV